MKIKLTKVSRPEGLDGGLRTPDVVGHCSKLPTIGEYFEMTAPSLTGGIGSTRFVNTSKVIDLSSAFTENKNIIYTLKTMSGSIYTVEVLDAESTSPVIKYPDPKLLVIIGDD